MKRFHEIFGSARTFHAPEVFICKAFKAAAVVILLQVLNNAANGHLRERLEGEIFSAFEIIYARGIVFQLRSLGISNSKLWNHLLFIDR